MKRYRLALCSCILAILAWPVFIGSLVLIYICTPSEEHYSPLYCPEAGIFLIFSMISIYMLFPAAFITGLIALRNIRKSEETDIKGKRAALIGVWVSGLIVVPIILISVIGLIFYFFGV